jgi:hypothetical protein
VKPFDRFDAALVRYPASFRCLVDAHSEQTAGDWRLLELECRDRTDRLNGYDPADEPPRKRHQPTPRRTAATSTRPGTVALSNSDDPLKAVPATTYFEALAGIVVPPNGRVSCPTPGHQDRNPSCRVYECEWYCFSCGAGGSIIDLSSAVSGIPATGRDYWRLRDWILERLVWAPLPGQRRADE